MDEEEWGFLELTPKTDVKGGNMIVNAFGGQGREKYWKELSTEEKIERMRQILKIAQRTSESIDTKVDKLNGEFDIHQHHDGKIMLPRQNDSFRRIGAHDRIVTNPTNPDEVYF